MLGKPASVTIRVDLTGDIGVTVGDAVVASSAFPDRKGRLAFAYLAAHRRPVPREELAEALWPSGRPDTWRRNLSVLVSRLRALLSRAGLDGSATLPGIGDCYQLRLPPGAEIDVDFAAARAEEATRALGEGDAERALAASLVAAEIARRPFLPGEEGDWIDARRQALDRVLLTALDVAAAVLADAGETERAVALGGEAVQVAPFRESGYTRLIRLQLAAGDRAEALRTYTRCRELLAQELGVDPAPETQAAYLDALRAGVRATVATESDGTRAGQEPLSNLPAPVDRFVGRERDLEAVATTLGSSRLVTLTGVGGVGKSRLALETAHRLAPAYPDGAWQCELSPVVAGPDVAHALAATFGVTHQQGLSAAEGVLRYLRGLRVLLVVDNCEHVLDAVASLLTALLRHCPHLAVLATSRERLAVRGEHVIDVQPLGVPAPGTDALAAPVPVPAVELFCVRASAVRAGFALTTANAAAVAEICRRVDGVPLALELAAARIGTLGVHEVATRLNQRFSLLTGGPRPGPARSQTLRATVDWSYDLLTAPQQQVFNRLSVFAGRFTLAAAEAVCGGDELTPATVLDAITALADKSMLVAAMAGEQTRYRLLETLREYGRRRLDESGDAAAAQRRHAVHFVVEAERGAEGVCGPDEANSVAELHAAFDDLRAAHRWCLQHGEADLAVRLVGALHWYAFYRGRSEVFVWAEQTLPLAASHPGLPAVCAAAGMGAWARGERRRAAELAQAGVAAAGASAARRLPLDVLGGVAVVEGRLDEAADLWEQALAAALETGDDFLASHVAANVALARAYQGDRQRAARAAATAHEHARAGNNPTSEAWAMYASAEIHAQNDPQRALGMLDESLKIARAVDNRFTLGVALLSASSLRGRHGDARAAVRLFLEVIPLWQRAGNWTQQWTTVRNVIELFVRLGVNRPAAVLIGAVEAATTAAPVYGADAERLGHARQTLTARLGTREFAAAIATGETMPPEAVIRFTCAELRRAVATSTPQSQAHDTAHPRREPSNPTT